MASCDARLFISIACFAKYSLTALFNSAEVLGDKLGLLLEGGVEGLPFSEDAVLGLTKVGLPSGDLSTGGVEGLTTVGLASVEVSNEGCL